MESITSARRQFPCVILSMGLINSIKYWLADGENKPTSTEKKWIKKIDAEIERRGKEKMPKINVMVVRDPEDNVWPFIETKWKDYRYKDTIKPTRQGEGYGGIYLEEHDLIIVNRSKSRKDIEEFKKIYIHERLHTAEFVHNVLMQTWETEVYDRIK
jgi:hypothetical protein